MAVRNIANAWWEFNVDDFASGKGDLPQTVPDIVQAGQWTYSPSGLPISILTGKLAADRVMKEIKKAH